MNKSILSIGLPSTGKTTYLAALWHVLESSESDNFEIEILPDDREYLNRIRDLWLRCTEQERTKLNITKEIKLKLRDKSSGAKFLLTFPDLSGELFQSQWENRILTEDYLLKIQDTSCFLLFLHSTQMQKPILIKQVNSILNIDQLTSSEIKEWNILEAPTQVLVVELLQFILEKKKERENKLSIMISAWDLLNDSITPGKWLEIEYPLLYQFLQSNGNIIKYQIFGVSAQGGDYKSIKSDLLRLEPTRRIYVFDEHIVQRDIVYPLLWLLNV